MSNMHDELAFGTPTDVSLLERTRRNTRRSPASKASTGAQQWSTDRRHLDTSFEASEPWMSLSDDTLSTFSCAGDLLPDEANGFNIVKPAETDKDFVAIKNIAHVLAKRRQVDPDKILPKLKELFGGGVDQSFIEEGRSSSLPDSLSR